MTTSGRHATTSLHEGILWPLEASAALIDAGLNGQGVREIVALATAAQAFEVCAGEITSTETAKDSRTHEIGADLKIDAGVKDLARALFGLGLGGLAGVGAGIAAGTGASTVVGLAAALSGTLAFNWSSKRTARSERARDYTFIRDRTKQTLERDLPLVIQRLREAGLAPVFVPDELDKLENVQSSVRELINGLKHCASSRRQSADTEVVYGVRSLRDLKEAVSRSIVASVARSSSRSSKK